jgi:C_GCAxxG_C_C family probable redox protein
VPKTRTEKPPDIRTCPKELSTYFTYNTTPFIMEKNTEQINPEERSCLAESLFRQGYNCAQSVAAAYADVYDIDKDLMLRFAASFGGGIGRMREVCGAACGMFIIAGLENGTTDPTDRAAKGRNYQTVQTLAKEFIECNGALRCADLLGIRTGKIQSPIPQKRDAEYYAKRPCPKIIKEAARILGDYLLKTREQEGEQI